MDRNIFLNFLPVHIFYGLLAGADECSTSLCLGAEVLMMERWYIRILFQKSNHIFKETICLFVAGRRLEAMAFPCSIYELRYQTWYDCCKDNLLKQT